MTHSYTLTGASGTTLTLNNSTIAINIGNGVADQIVLQGSATASVNGTNIIAVNSLTGASSVTNYVIISATGGITGTGSFVLSNANSLPPLFIGIITQTGTSVVLSYGPVSTVYWEGNGTSDPGGWDDVSNFTTDIAGTQPLNAQFGVNQDVVFSANGASNQGFSVLNVDATAKSLIINDPTSVAIFNPGGANTLTISGTAGNTGIITGSLAGAAIFNANLDLAGIPNITVNNRGGLSIGGVISGTNGLIVNGTNTLTLTGTNTSTGGTQLQSGTLNISSDSNLGQSGSGNGVTFKAGAGNNVVLQSSTAGGPGSLTTAGNRNFIFSSGTGTIDPGPSGYTFNISGTVSGSGALQLIDSGQLIFSGSDNFNGAATISSGTLTIMNVGSMGATGTSSYNIASGATLALNAGSSQDWEDLNVVTFGGNGNLLLSSLTTFQIHDARVNFSMSGGTIEVASGTLINGGPLGNGGIVWTNNKASLLLDAGTAFDPWDQGGVTVDALLGSGSIERSGFGPGLNTITIGNNNGSGVFSGSIQDGFGSLGITKIGTGTQTFSNNNTYTGPTIISGGALKITASNGLGFGGNTYVAPGGGGQHTATVSGSATLDLAGNLLVNKAIALNGGRLINSMVGTTSVLDSGIAGITFTTDPNIVYSGSLGITGGSGSGFTAIVSSTQQPGGTNVGTNNNLYTQTLTAGSGYTPGAGAPTVTITQSGSNLGGTVTAVVSSLALTGNDVIGGNGNLTINAQVSGAGNLNTIGSGTLTLTGQETYTGSTNVNSGVFAVNGSLAAASVVTVGGANGAGTPTLGGGNEVGLVSPTYTPGTLASKVYASSATVGNVQGAVTINGPGGGAAGILAPGNSVGTITVGSLTMNAGSIANYEFNGTANDFTAVTGALSLTGVGFNLYSEGTTSMFTTPGTYALFSYGTTGSITGLSVLNGDTTDFTYVFNLDSTDKLVTLTIAANSGGNTSVLAITPSPISLGNVLVNASATGSGTLTNTDSSASANYTMNTSGSIGVTPGSGSNLTPGSTQALSVTGTVGNTSGSNSIVGTISATNTSGGSNAPSVNVTANIYNAATVTPSGNGQTLTNNGAGTLVASAKIQTNTINAASTQNASSWTASSGTIAAGNTGTVETLSPTLLLNGTYHGTANLVVGNVAKDGSAISGATTGDVLNNASYAFSGVVSGNTSTGRGNIYSAQILSGSSYAGYSLGASPGISTHLATGPAANMTTQATLSYGTASAVANVNMSFDNTPAAGAGTDNSFRTSDILTLTGIHSVGTSGAVTLTDKYVLQLSYDNTVPTAGVYRGRHTIEQAG